MYSTTGNNAISSSMKPSASKFQSVDSVYNYLIEPCSTEEVVSSTATSSTNGSNRAMDNLQAIKKPKKEKELANVENPAHPDFPEMGRFLPSGRVKYGPVTVNPRKKPSKTLFTGRRSKYEVLSGDDEVKRSLRRDRNRVAATKCRTKRETVLTDLENQYNREMNHYNNLSHHVQQLTQYKQHLQALLVQPLEPCPVAQINSTPPPQQPSIISSNTGYLSSIMETSAAPTSLLPSHQLQLIENDEENSSLFLQSTSLLINSAYHTDQLNPMFNTEQQTIIMTTSSLERLINSLQSPPLDSAYNNCNNSSELFNSTYDSSSYTQGHFKFQ